MIQYILEQEKREQQQQQPGVLNTQPQQLHPQQPGVLLQQGGQPINTIGGIGETHIIQQRVVLNIGSLGQPMTPGQPMVARQFLPQQGQPGVMTPVGNTGPRMPGQVWRHPQVCVNSNSCMYFHLSTAFSRK